jgi:photosystem II stability/assembly factor-like uncharacterized protein
VNAVVVDARGTRDTLYAGVDGGVYVSRDEGASWRRYGHGLPHASAKALDINTDLGVLVVGLNGRSAWRIRIADPTGDALDVSKANTNSTTSPVFSTGGPATAITSR